MVNESFRRMLCAANAGSPLRAARTVLAAGLVALLPGMAQADDVSIDNDYWRVVELGGGARILAGANSWNREAPLAVGDAVGPYQAVATNRDSHLVLMRGEDIVVLYATTTMVMPAPDDSHTETYLAQENGDAFYVVEPRPAPEFTVETPYLIAGIKGTQFGLNGDAAWLAVIEGLVDARSQATGTHADTPSGTGISGQGGRFAPRALTDAQIAALHEQMAWVATNRGAWQDRQHALQEQEYDAAVTALADAGESDGGTIGSAANGVVAAAGLDRTLGESLSTLGGTLGTVGTALSETTDTVGNGLTTTLDSLGSGLSGSGSGGSSAAGSSSGSSGSGGSGSGGSSGGSGGSGSGGSLGGSIGGAVGGVGDAVGGAVGGLL